MHAHVGMDAPAFAETISEGCMRNRQQWLYLGEALRDRVSRIMWKDLFFALSSYKASCTWSHACNFTI